MNDTSIIVTDNLILLPTNENISNYTMYSYVFNPNEKVQNQFDAIEMCHIWGITINSIIYL